MGPFTDMEQLKQEKERLRRLNHQHALRLKVLGRELADPGTVGGLLKNSLFGRFSSLSDNGNGSDLIRFLAPAVKIGGLVLGSRFLAKRGRLLQVAGLLMPILFKGGPPSLDRISNELHVSYERLKEHWKERHSEDTEKPLNV